MTLPFTTGLYAWYDASQITGQSDDTLLSTFPDLSGNGYNATAAGAARPTYYKTTSAYLVNGLPTVVFGADTIYMGTSTGTLAQPATYILCCYIAALNAGSQRIMDAGSPRTLIDITASNGYPGIYLGATSSFGPVATTTGTHIMSVLCDGNSSYIRWDGDQGSTLSPGANGNKNWSLGGYPNATAFNGTFCELIMYSGAVSTANIESVESYLEAKWLPPTTIPGDPIDMVV